MATEYDELDPTGSADAAEDTEDDWEEVEIPQHQLEITIQAQARTKQPDPDAAKSFLFPQNCPGFLICFDSQEARGAES